MKIKIQLGLAVLGLGLALGCQSNQGKIAFTDDAALPRLTTNAYAPPQVKGLEKAEVVQIELQVFSALLTRHFWQDADYTAIFLQADEAEVAALQKKYPDRVPPIKSGQHADLRLNRTPLDRDTGKRAMMLSVDVNEPAADGSVPTIGKWYAGGAVTGFYSFVLKKNGEGWVIQDPE